MKQILLSIGFLKKHDRARVWKRAPAWVLFLALIFLSCNCSNKKQDIKNPSQNSSLNIKNNKKNDILDTNQIIQNLKNQIIEFYNAIDSSNFRKIISFLPNKYIDAEGGYNQLYKKIKQKKILQSELLNKKVYGLQIYKVNKILKYKDTVQTTLGSSIKFLPEFLGRKYVFVCISYNCGLNWKFIIINSHMRLTELIKKFPYLNLSNKIEIPILKQDPIIIFPKDYHDTIIY